MTSIGEVAGERMPAKVTLISVVCLASGLALGQPLSITFRNTSNLGSTATDQLGQSFTVTGLSGLVHRSGDEYLAVMDNSNKLVRIHIQLSANGAISGAAILGGVSLTLSRDFEGIAIDGKQVLLAEETSPAVLRLDLSTGSLLQVYAAPEVFAAMRPNRGFESLARRSDAAGFWTANEEALTVDGPASSASSGTIVRLVRYGTRDGTLEPGPHFAYEADDWHGSAVTEARSGVAELLVLPDGRMLVLERSFAFSVSGFFRTRIYSVDFTAASDVSTSPGLIGQSFTPVVKSLLYQGDQQNMEGLAIGPPTGPGKYSLLGIVDDGDPISVNRLVAFELSGVGDCETNCDLSTGVPLLTANDFQCFLNRFAAGDIAANCDGSSGAPVLTSNDFQCFLNRFAAGC